jgi:hypothetical protein
VSVELEVASSDGKRHSTEALWTGAKIVRDGSLPDGGWELNSAPASGDKFVSQLYAIANAMSADNAAIDTSCGFHVHVDARDFTWIEIGNLIRVYAKIESALFSVVSRSRRDNRFCKQCGMMFLDRLDGATHGSDDAKAARTIYDSGPSKIASAKRDKYDNARYTALNLHSWVYRGTVECRLHQGTVNKERVLHWSALWAAIVDYAKTHNGSELPCNSFDALLSIAPNESVKRWLDARKARFSRVQMTFTGFPDHSDHEED